MITLNFSVDNQLLTRTDENTVAANSHLVHVCEFTFSSEWDNRGKVATFKKRDLVLSVILKDDACTIPPEILQSENKIDVFELSVCGADGNSTITSTVVKVPILAGTWDVMSTEITPTMFEQIMQKIDEVEKGEVSPELIAEAVSDYMEAHPLEPIVAEDVAAYFEEHKSEFKGDTGATPAITATAEVNNAVGTPSVTVTKTGTAEAPNLNFSFQNLKGDKGDNGTNGKSAYQIAVDNGFEGTEAEWLESLKGESGASGDNAEIAKAAEKGGYKYIDASEMIVTVNGKASAYVNKTITDSKVVFDIQHMPNTNTSELKTGAVNVSISGCIGAIVKITDPLNLTKNTLPALAKDTSTWVNMIAATNVKTLPDGSKLFYFEKDDLTQYPYIVVGWQTAGTKTGNEYVYPEATTITYEIYRITPDNINIATRIIGVDDEYEKCIVAWGDSLTKNGGWTNKLSELSGLPLYNAGTGGENMYTIAARQGADVMICNNITIPNTAGTHVTIATRAEGGILTEFGKRVTPLLQGGGDHVNPCYIDNVRGVLSWMGTNATDQTGYWAFAPNAKNNGKTIKRPTAIRTAFDINHNNPYLMVIYIGMNAPVSPVDEFVQYHKLMIQHANAKHVIMLGVHSGIAAGEEYITAMKKAFGRYYISLKEYLAHPIYDTDGETIISCYGLDDAELTPTAEDLTAISNGECPPQLMVDGIHYTDACKAVIGNMIYKKCQELNIF